MFKKYLLSFRFLAFKCIHANRSFHIGPVLYKKSSARTLKPIVYPKKSSKELINVWRNITVEDLAKSLETSTDEVFDALSFVPNGDRYDEIDSVIDDLEILRETVRKFDRRFRMVSPPSQKRDDTASINKDATPQPPASPDRLSPRPPVIAVMGHVDHGKTSLLDAIRNSRVVDSEFGGITQHIGAFVVTLPSGEKLTFLDTPGHAAFTAMRERGANVTDIVVLVVAADDGVMEQTIESIRMARNAQVPIIVCINKIDKPNADVARAEKMLSVQGVQVENLGGDVQAVAVSALTGQNLPHLLEAIAVQAEILSLQADYSGLVEGAILESRLDPGRGKLSTTLVKRGTLRKGAVIVAGTAWAKVRAMFDDKGSPVEKAIPGTPVQVIGWRELPDVGEIVLEVVSEKRANEVVRWRERKLAEEKINRDAVAIKEKEQQHQIVYKAKLEEKRKMGRFRIRPTGPRQKEITWDETDPRVNIIVKGDVVGSVEAILDILDTYDCAEECKLDVVHYGAGAITENDVELAVDFNAVIYAFNVNVPPAVEKFAKTNNIEIKPENVIYRLIGDLKKRLSSKMKPKVAEETIGEAKVQQVFMVTEGKKKVPVAGCRCTKGELKKDGLYKIIRDGEITFKGTLTSMRHLKNEVGTVKRDVECGLMFTDGPDELLSGDTVICYKLVDVPQASSWDPGF